jgi:hypothetical protein
LKDKLVAVVVVVMVVVQQQWGAQLLSPQL